MAFPPYLTTMVFPRSDETAPAIVKAASAKEDSSAADKGMVDAEDRTKGRAVETKAETGLDNDKAKSAE